jgi:type I restriction enzyme S subunit
MEEAKNTRAFYYGHIPKDWEVSNLGEMTTLLTNGFVGKAKDHYVETEDGVLYLQGYNISDSGFNFNGIKKVSKEFHEKNAKSCLQEGDLLTIQTGEIGLTSVVPRELVGSNCHALVISRLKPDIAYPNFYLQYFNSEIGKRKFKTIETGSTMKHLNVGDMDSLEFPIPPLSEQKAIAQVLSTADAAIHTTEKLIAQKELRKKWLMQQLLTGKKRLKGFSGEVKLKLVEHYLKEISERNKELKITNVLSVTNSRGFINQADQFDRVVASEDATNYKIVRKGQFAYNPSRVNVGSLDLLRYFESGILSPMYVVFETDKSQLLPDYFYYQLKTQWFYGHIPMFVQGSVRDSLSFDGLCSMKFFIPSIEEQTAIAQVLQAADKEISLLKAKSEKLREQKKGLMQVLLTGKVRLKIDN